MRSILKIFTLLLLLPVSFLQAQQKEQLLLVYEEKAKLDQIAEYEKMNVLWYDLITAGKLDVPVIRVSQTDNFTFYYVTLLDNMEGVNDISARFNAVKEKTGKEKWEQIALSPSTEYRKQYVIKWVDDYSYMPAKVNIENEFIYWDYYYCKPEKRNEALQLMKEFKQIYVDAKAPIGFVTYLPVLGQDQDLITITWESKDLETHLRETKELWAKIKDKAEPLFNKFMTCVRDWKSEFGMYRKDLTYIKNEAALKEK